MKTLNTFLLTTLTICGMITLQAGEILKNGDFSKPDPVLNNRQTAWEIFIPKGTQSQIRNACVFADGIATLKLPQGVQIVFLLQRNLPLKLNQRYKVSYEVKGSGQYNVYVEWVRSDKSYKSYPSVKSSVSNPEWEKQSFEFTLTDRDVHPYLGIALKSGTASFRNLSIQEL